MSTQALLLSTKVAWPLIERRDCLCLHLGDTDSYQLGHLPGAQLLEPNSLRSGHYPAVGGLPERQQLEQLFSAFGLVAGQPVIAYDNEGGGWAGRLFWTLEVLGHQPVSVIDGGLVAWRAAGLPLEQGSPAPTTPSDYRCRALRKKPIADLEEIVARLHEPGLVLWDARSQVEYEGLRSPSQRHGHIPGAKHCEWLELMDQQRHRCLLPADTLCSLLTERGIHADAEIITYCQSHHRSALCYLAGRTLGLNIRAYPGAWAEWGNRDDTPVSCGPSAS